MVVSCRSLQCGQSNEAKTSIVMGAAGLPMAFALSISGIPAKQGSSRASARAKRFIYQYYPSEKLTTGGAKNRTQRDRDAENMMPVSLCLSASASNQKFDL